MGFQILCNGWSACTVVELINKLTPTRTTISQSAQRARQQNNREHDQSISQDQSQRPFIPTRQFPTRGPGSGKSDEINWARFSVLLAFRYHAKLETVLRH
jgi:hypothetical protein